MVPDPATSPTPPRARPGVYDTSPWLDGTQLTLLVADESEETRDRLSGLTRRGDVAATFCADGAQALWSSGRLTPDVVILSASLPVVAAAVVVRIIAGQETRPSTILLGVGLGEAEQARAVLAAGADRVVARPYQEREVEPILRRHLNEVEQRRIQGAVLRHGPLELNGPAFEARAAGRLMGLGLREFELLRLLMRHAEQVVSHHHIRQEIWGVHGETTIPNTVAGLVRQVRGHLAGVADVVAVRGVGYKLTLREREAAASSNGRPAGSVDAG